MVIYHYKKTGQKFFKKQLSLVFFLICFSQANLAQEKEAQINQSNFSIRPEILIGITGEANKNFPDRNLQKQLYFHFGLPCTNNNTEWKKRLKNPTTGISLGITDFGNTTELGYALSVLPFIEFPIFRKESLKLQLATGASYFSQKFHPYNNPNNKAVSTHFTWAFRAFSYYEFFKSKPITWRFGLGYAHHSNGHIKLPNQGFNSFLASISADFTKQLKATKAITQTDLKTKNNAYSYWSVRTGYGSNTLSRTFNTAKDVYTFSAEVGKVYHKIYKVGFGFYYRFYENYYNYIKNNESLVQDGREFESFKENPFWNASNLGISINSELLLNHIGIDLQLGFNVYKPAYKIDWRINQGWEIVPQEIPENSNIVLGEFNTYYKIKHLISSRLGLKYYLKPTDRTPKNNFYLGAFINGNLGQADFSEIAVGYVRKM